MTIGIAPFMAQLGLAPDADERAIRRAYAVQLKQIDQEADPEGFQSLREAYDSAMLWVRHRRDIDHGQPPYHQTSNVAAATPDVHATATAAASSEDDPVSEAVAVFAEFRQRAQALPADDDFPWQQALQLSLNDERLVSIRVRELFEYHIADLLAAGWQPGHEALLVAATTVFGWRDDRRRVQHLGNAGEMLDIAIEERAIFDQQAADLRYNQRQLISRLRDDTPPTTRQLMEGKPLLEQLIASFPTWLSMVTSTAHIIQWRTLHAELSRWRKLPFQIEFAASKFVSGRIGLLIWAIFIGMLVLGSLIYPGQRGKQPLADTAAQYVQRGTAALDQRHLTDAIDQLTRAARLVNNANTYSLRAIAYAWNGQLELAQRDIDQSSELDGANPLLFRARGALAYERKQYANAIDAFTRSLQLEPDHTFTLIQRSYAYFEQHDYLNVMTDTDQVLKLDPAYGEAYSLRLEVAWVHKNKAAALKEIQTMLTAMPNNSYAYHVAAVAYKRWGQPSEAIEVLTSGIERSPAANLYRYRAELRPPAQLAEKRSDLAKALSLAPDSFKIVRDNAELEINTGNFSNVPPIISAALNAATLSNDQRSTLLGLRGIAYTGSGGAALAQSDYDAARSLVDNANGLNNLCWLLASHNSALDIALALCDASLAKSAHYAAALDSRGMVLLRMGRYRDAIDAYNAALVQRPSYTTSLYGRGLAKHKLGKHDSGNADLKAARAIDDEVDQEFGKMGLKAG